MRIEGVIRPQLRQIIIDALKNDPLAPTGDLHADNQEAFQITCAQKSDAPVVTIDLSSIQDPEIKLTAGVCQIGDTQTVIIKRSDTTNQKTVAEETLSSFCSQVNCAANGCAVLREKQAGLEARKQPNRKRTFRE